MSALTFSVWQGKRIYILIAGVQGGWLQKKVLSRQNLREPVKRLKYYSFESLKRFPQMHSCLPMLP